MAQNSLIKNECIDIPWVEKYRPQSTKTMGGSERIISLLKEFLQEFQNNKTKLAQLKKLYLSSQKELEKKKLKIKINSLQERLRSKKARLLIGPPGVGKTTIVYALANDFNLSVIELNASDARTEDALKEKLQETVKSTNLLSFTSNKTKGKLILIDEVDGIHGQSDKGGVATLEKIIGYSKYPIIMTCNFRDDKKFKSLYELAKPIIEVIPAQVNDIQKILEKIVKAENRNVSSEQLKQIATRCNGDYRSAINDLQALTQGSNELDDGSLNELNMRRDTESDIQEFMQNLVQADSILRAKKALDDVNQKDVDFKSIHKWINENLPSYITKKKDIRYAYENIATADGILGYILRTQDYGHLGYYFDILAGGVRLSKSDQQLPKTSIRPPRWFRLRAAPEDPLTLRLQEMFRVSLNTIMKETKPNLRLFLKYKNDLKNYIAQIANEDPKKIEKLLL